MIISEEELRQFVGGQARRRLNGQPPPSVYIGEIQSIRVEPMSELAVKVTVTFAWLAEDTNANRNKGQGGARWERRYRRSIEFTTGSFKKLRVEGADKDNNRLCLYCPVLVDSWTFYRPDDPELFDPSVIED